MAGWLVCMTYTTDYIDPYVTQRDKKKPTTGDKRSKKQKQYKNYDWFINGFANSLLMHINKIQKFLQTQKSTSNDFQTKSLHTLAENLKKPKQNKQTKK